MRIWVVVLDEVFDTGLASILDTFETATQLGDAKYDVIKVGVRAHVHTHHGLLVPTVQPPKQTPDLVVVPAVACKDPESILGALERPDIGDAGELLRKAASRGAKVAAACTGTFVLASTGLLDGHRATTSWWLGPAFRSKFPDVELEEGAMVIGDRGVLTAGAALAHLDLALAVIRGKSPNLAALVAKYLLIEDRPSQAPFVAPAHVAHDDELVKKFETWTRRHLAEPFELARAAKAIGASERTLQRRIRAVLGKRPVELVQDLRCERAAHMLRVSQESVDDVARAVGYEDASTLRTLLRRRLGHGVRDLRRTA